MMMKGEVVLALTIVMCSCVHLSQCSKRETDLITSLLDGYEVAARPVNDFNDPVNVTLDIALNQIFDIDEKNQILRTSVWLRMKWHDNALQWNTTENGGLKAITLASNRVWRPDITLWNNAGATFAVGQDTQVKITSIGEVTWNTPAMLESTCAIDVEYFPFDEQNCSMKFGSWSLHGWQLDLFSKSKAGDTDSFVDNGEWNLVEMPVVKTVETYNCCPEPYPDLTYHIIVRRRSLYYIFNLVFPVILITMITMLAFYLPPESGEKVALGVTVLLAMTVFLLIIAESMPATSAAVPLIGQFFGATIIMLGLSTAMTVIVLHIHFKGSQGKPVPWWLHRLVLGCCAKVLCMDPSDNSCRDGHKITRIISENGISSHNAETIHLTTMSNHDVGDRLKSPKVENLDSSVSHEMLRRLTNIEQVITSHLEDNEKQEKLDNDWRKVAMVIDRLFLVVFFASTLLMCLVILLNRPSSTFN